MAKNMAELHDSLQLHSPKGIGIGISLVWLQQQFTATIDAIGGKARPGVNEQIPLSASTRVQVAFRSSSAHFKFDIANQTISIMLGVWLHVAGDPNARIITFQYEIANAPIIPVVDQSTFQVSLEPANITSANLTNQTYDSNADAALIAAGYADKNAFEHEVLYPFIWLNSQGLVRSVFRSLAVPDFLTSFGVIKPVIPAETKIEGEYLLLWTERAVVDLGLCGTQPSPIGQPNTHLQLRSGTPPPAHPLDSSSPRFAMYCSGTTILNWHTQLLMPAVMISHAEDGFIGWRYDAAAGLDSLSIDLVPSSQGGSIEADAGLKLVGVASAWMNGPCGIKVGLIDGALQGDAGAGARFKVLWESLSYQVKAGLDVNAKIGQVKISLGGIFGPFLQIALDALTAIGVIKIQSQISRHSDSTLMDLSGIRQRWNPKVRVGTGSALIACYPSEDKR